MKVFCRNPLSNFPEVLLKAGGPWGILSLLAQETEALVLGGAEGKLSGDRIWEISGFLLILVSQDASSLSAKTYLRAL